MATYLDRILSDHRALASSDDRGLEGLIDQARCAPPTRGFDLALRDRPAGEPAVIAEVKRRSPSRGDLAADLDPADPLSQGIFDVKSGSDGTALDGTRYAEW